MAVKLFEQAMTSFDLEAHGRGLSLAPEYTLQRILGERHQGYQVVPISHHSISLLDFAKQGHARYEILESAPFTSMVLYEKVPGLQHDKILQSDQLKQKNYFAAYRFIWESDHGSVNDHSVPTQHVFLVYEITLQSYQGETSFHFLLAPTTPKDLEAHPNVLDTVTKELLAEAGEWNASLHNEIWVYDGCWRKSKRLWEATNSASWDDICLDVEMKQALINDVDGFFDSQDLYKEFNVAWKRGIIFHGPPGNGKTMSIRAIMGGLMKRDSVSSLYVKSFQHGMGGVFAIRQIFHQARSMAPCVLVLEDLDSLVTEKLRSYFLNEVDGLRVNDGILMIASTNHLDKLDPALRDRPSRFDRKYAFKLPGPDNRLAFAEKWRAKIETNPLVQFPTTASGVIAELTDGFSFAYLNELFISVMMTMARREQERKKSNVMNDDPDSRNIVPHTLNTNEVSPAVQDSEFLSLMHEQAQALRNEMANDKKEEEGKKKN